MATREGARAAWSFVADDIFEHWGSAASGIIWHNVATGDTAFVKSVHDNHRRELEGMK